MFNNDKLDKLTAIFESFNEIKLVYFFGSKADGSDGPMSDYDFALYLEKKDVREMFDIKFKLQDRLSRELATDKVDVVVLNLSEGPEFKYNVIKNGRLIFEKEPYRVLIEPMILNEYFDFIYTLRKYGLTKT